MVLFGDWLEFILRKIFLSFENRATKHIRTVARETIRELILTTPYKTGQAKSNWRANLNTVDKTVIEAYYPWGGTGGNESLALSYANEAIDRFKVGKGDVIIISNPVPYLRRLNAGSSTQAPAGFIEAAILRGRQIAKQKMGD